MENNEREAYLQDLMDRIRTGAAEAGGLPEPLPDAARRAATLPMLPTLNPPPAFAPRPSSFKKERLFDLLNEARSKTQVSRTIPKFLRGLFRRQGAFNDKLLTVTTTLVKNMAELNSRLQQPSAAADREWMETACSAFTALTSRLVAGEQTLQTLVEYQAAVRDQLKGLTLRADGREEHAADLQGQIVRLGKHLTDLHRISDAAEIWRTAIRADLIHVGHRAERRVNEEASRHDRVLEKLESKLAEIQKTAGDHEQQISAATRDLLALAESYQTTERVAETLRDESARNGEHLRNLQELVNGFATREPQAREQGRLLQALRDQSARDGEHLRNLQQLVDGITAREDQAHERLVEGAITSLREKFLRSERSVSLLEERVTSDGAYLKAELALLRCALASSAVRNSGYETESSRLAAEPVNSVVTHRLDAFYVRFEDQFRGSRDEIKSRLSYYLPILKAAGIRGDERPVLDLGCGRGEWLELLRDNENKAHGVDLNAAMIAQCRERGFEVTMADALEHLRGVPADSYGAVTGFHIIEHLSLEMLLAMINEIERVLQPGGLVIFESPNCKNLVVGATNFNIDPTHRNAIFPETAQFMLSLSGFEPVKIEYLSPVEAPRFEKNGRMSEVLHELLYGPQDFSVVGHKAAAR